MLMAVVVLNFSLALFGLYVAWQAWRMGRGLRQVADSLTAAERSVNQTLYGAPGAIAQGQINLHHLRQQLQQIGPQVQRLRQAIALVSLAQSLWVGGMGFGSRGDRTGARAKSRKSNQSRRSPTRLGRSKSKG
ncbi:MAG: hypothetical protein OHK0037_04520 [Elainellaceae cyanobacterium]